MEKVLINSFQVISWLAIVKYFKNFTFYFFNEVSLFDFQSNDNVMKKEKMLMITGLNTPRTMHLIYFKKIFYQTPLFL